jgi:hypothetical protein
MSCWNPKTGKWSTETLGEAADRTFFERKKRDHSLADSNPDYVKHESLYRKHHIEGFMDGAEWFCQKAFSKSLREVMKP